MRAGIVAQIGNTSLNLGRDKSWKELCDERYIVAGRYFEVEDILKALEKVTGVPHPKMRIPHGVIMLYAWAMEIYGRLTGKPILVSRQGVQTLHAKTRVDSARAARELGATFRPLEQTLKDEVEWYKQHGYA